MKKTQLIINACFGAAIVALFVLFFLSKNTCCPSGSGASAADTIRKVTIPARIAFVNIDTLNKKYEYYLDMETQFSKKQKAAEQELSRKSESLQRKAMDYQTKMQKGLLTRAEAQQIEEQLGQEQQNLMQLRDQMTQNLAEEEQVLQRKLVNDILEFVKAYNNDKHYQCIISKGFGSNVLYASDSLDITNDVINGLNDAYRKTKASSAK